MKDNLVFLAETDLDNSVYRIFSFQRLKEIFQESKLTLVKPKLWDDPFENFILNSTGILRDGRKYFIGFRNNFYGQCWSLTKESDAMWRIYSPKKDGVKVKTTIRKLFNPLFQIGRQFRNMNGVDYNLSSFVGKVKYANSKILIEMLKDEKRMSGKIFDQSGWGQASTFFFKRTEFKHEKEVRLIYFSQNDNQLDTFKFAINPSEMFDEIVFDPRMTESVYEQQKNNLIDWGFNKRIVQSELYKLKKFTIALRAEN